MRIKAAETPDELVDYLRALTNRCNFPTDEEKEQNVQFCLAHALTNSELVKTLLTLDLKATTAKMLKTCRTHVAIADNLNAMGLGSNCQCCQQMESTTSVLPTITATKSSPTTGMHVGIALSPMCLAEPPALPRTPHADHVAELAATTSDAKAPLVDRRIQTRSHPDVDPKVENKSRPTLLM